MMVKMHRLNMSKSYEVSWARYIFVFASNPIGTFHRISSIAFQNPTSLLLHPLKRSRLMETRMHPRNLRLAIPVLSLLIFSAFTLKSGNYVSRFNYAVSPAGDVNGDGYADLLMSIFRSDYGISKDGRVSLYLGTGNGIGQEAVWTGTCAQTAASFGETVANAGDVNGDGFADIIVGASHYSNGQDNEGAAFVYYGSPQGLSKTPSWTAESNQANAFFGNSVSSAGDVNKDGFADVVVGAPLYDDGETNEGAIFVYLGSINGLSKEPSWYAEGDQVSANFGKAVASAGDVNHDGYSDIIVGAPSYDNGQNNEGRAFLFLGSIMGITRSPAWTGESNQADANYGSALACAGDVNGDGFSDVVIGANRWDEQMSNMGKIYVYMGSSNGFNLYPDWTFTGSQVDGNLGISVASAGDVNGDGYSEVIVGNYPTNQEKNKGSAFVYYGSTRGMSDQMASISLPNNPLASIGLSVASAGDTNGDGYADVIAGVIWDQGENSTTGKAMIVQGSAKGLMLGAIK
jgi:hypothetical protein